MNNTLDVLLAGTARDVSKEPMTKQFEVLRLTELYGAPVILDVQGASYNFMKKIVKEEDMDIQLIMECVKSPDLSDVRLAQSVGLLKEGEAWGDHGVLRKHLIPKLFLPGEITAIANAIEELSGYRSATLQAVKKN